VPGYVRARGKRKDGSTKWQARWRPADDPSDANREEQTFRTKRDAERWIAKRDSDVLRGSYAPAKSGRVLFGTVLELVRSKWDMRLEPKTRAGYEAILSRWLIGEVDPLHPSRPCRFRNVEVGSITTKMAQDFVNELWKERAPNTVRRIFGVLKAVTKEAARAGYIAADPCAAVELPTKKKYGVRRSHLYLEGDELLTLADALPAHWRLPVLLDGSTGLRAGELWALRRRDVDLLHRELDIRFALKAVESSHLEESLKGLSVGHPKSAASRRRLKVSLWIKPLLEEAMSSPGVRSQHGYAVARERPEDQDHADLEWSDDPNDPDRLLFVTPLGYPVRHNLFYKRVFRPAIVGREAQPARLVRTGNGFRRIPAQPAIAAALPARLHKLRFHDLRHTAAALSLANGGTLATVKERLGHENFSTTADLYNKRVPSVDEAIADAVGDAIFLPRKKANVEPLRRVESQ
jgi:integrase